MAYEMNRNGRYYCDRLGAACNFRIVGLESDRLVEWILELRSPLDLLYFYGGDRPVYVSYGLQHKRDIWTFTEKGMSTRKSLSGALSKSSCLKL